LSVTSPIIKEYGLWAVLVILVTENMGIIFMPGESIIVAASYFAAKGVLSIYAVDIMAILASITGGLISFELGLRYGHAKLIKYGKYIGVSVSSVDKVHSFFTKYGAAVVCIGRFIVPLRQLQGYLAGSTEMNERSYIVWGSIGAVLWVSFWSLSTYLLASNIHIN
jgi:membrane protein DedA with SNARE-associated domain